jgi:imidazolonepropionase-like amidohydrolase
MAVMTAHARVASLWTGQGWISDALVSIDDTEIRPAGAADTPPDVGRIEGTLLPPLTDAHVHIGLSDFAVHGGRRVARLLDLGWNRSLMSTVDRCPATEVLWAGQFLTAPGGYPSTRAWAPDGSVREVSDPDDATVAVRELHDIGAAVVKITLNSQAGPVFDDAVLAAVVATAHELGLPVVAHVEGLNQPERAARAGVDCFAHAPWTHRLADAELRAMEGTVAWISTLDMHGRGRYGRDYATALDNLTRFAALGGSVVYGTDLGNAITTADLNLREVDALWAAGITGGRLLRALTGTGLLPPWSRTATLLPGHVTDADEAVAALPSARPVDAAALRELAT